MVGWTQRTSFQVIGRGHEIELEGEAVAPVGAGAEDVGRRTSGCPAEAAAHPETKGNRLTPVMRIHLLQKGAVELPGGVQFVAWRLLCRWVFLWYGGKLWRVRGKHASTFRSN